MRPPELWIVAGPNGAGKTTCVQSEPIARLLPGVTFLNPDDRTRAKLIELGYRGFSDTPADVQERVFLQAATEVEQELEQAIDDGMAVGVETVLSTNKYQPLVEKVIDRGGFVGLIYIALSSPELAADRVARRVREGGHGVPKDKIRQRWTRSLKQLAWFAGHATSFWVFDNSDSDVTLPPPLIAHGTLGRLPELSEVAFPELRAAFTLPP